LAREWFGKRTSRKTSDNSAIKSSANPTAEREPVSEPIEVPDPWFDGGSGPFILEKRPDIPTILSAPNPRSPKPEAQWNEEHLRDPEYTRKSLAMAYLRHPDAQVRADTLIYVGSQPTSSFRVGVSLAQRLTVDPVKDLRRVSALMIWKRGSEELLNAMSYLAGNDESPGDDGNGALVSREDVRTALQILHDANTAAEDDFRNALLEAWCRYDPGLAQLCGSLVSIWLESRTYSNEPSRTSARQIGEALYSAGGLDAMILAFRPITLLAGSEAADDLNHAWSRVGGWCP
jgi:hypothetical protein